MRYIKLKNNQATNYSIEQLLKDHPDAKIYSDYGGMPNESLLKEYDVYPLITTTKPNGDVVEEDLPVFNGVEWIQTWTVKDYTEEQINEINKNNDSNIPPELIGFVEELSGENTDDLLTPFLKNKDSSPFFVDKITSDYRYDICKSCDKFINLTKQCKECGCFMTLKTKLKIGTCPLNKW